MEIRHNGLARFGELHLDPSGILSMRQSDDKEYLSFGGLFPTLDNILSLSADTIPQVRQVGRVSKLFSGTSATGLGATQSITLLSAGAHKATIGMQIRIQGQLDLSVTSPPQVPDSPHGGLMLGSTPMAIMPSPVTPPDELMPTEGSAQVDIYLRIGSSLRLLESHMVRGIQTKSITIDRSWTTSEEGEVSLVAECLVVLGGSAQRAGIEMYDFKLWGLKRHEDFDLIKFTHGGTAYLYGIDKYVYISRTDPNVMTIGGSTLQRGDHRIEGNLEVTGAVTSGGSLARGEVSRAGHIVWYNGCRAIPAGRTTGFAERLSDMSYKVYHNVGHTHYAVSITPTEDTAPICACVIERASTYFKVMLRKGWDGNMATNKISSAFMYTIEGNLTAQ